MIMMMTVMVTMTINDNKDKYSDDEDDENGIEGYDNEGNEQDNDSIIIMQHHAKDDKDNKIRNSCRRSPISGVMDGGSGSLFIKVIAQ